MEVVSFSVSWVHCLTVAGRRFLLGDESKSIDLMFGDLKGEQLLSLSPWPADSDQSLVPSIMAGSRKWRPKKLLRILSFKLCCRSESRMEDDVHSVVISDHNFFYSIGHQERSSPWKAGQSTARGIPAKSTLWRPNPILTDRPSRK